MDFFSLPPEVQEQILDGPAVPPPDDVIPNLNPVPQNTPGYVVISLSLAISTIVFFIRSYGTWFVTKKPRLSDYFIIPTYILFVAFCAVTYAEIGHGYFVHIWDYTGRDLPSLTYLYINSISLYAVTLMLIKVVILLEWLHIFVPPGTRNYFFWIAHILMWTNVVFYSAAILIINLSCNPREKYWNRLLPGTCLGLRPLEITSALVNFLIDLGILLLPQRVIWHLNMSSKRRAGVSAIFSLGVLAVATAGYRSGFTIEKTYSNDLTFDYSLVGLLLAVEITCGIVIFCLPACPKAVAGSGLPKLYSRLKSLTGPSSRGGSNHVTGPPSWPGPRPRQRLRNGNSSNGTHGSEDAYFVRLETVTKYGSESGLNDRPSTSGEHLGPKQGWTEYHGPVVPGSVITTVGVRDPPQVYY